MRLKRLDIFAFKSFMDRTSLSFSPGLSAIVGPNGCGKSNLIESIRWAMGEQSARSLRGRLMEDVIFGGTGGRRPVGVAEVSLTLESANGHPPECFAGASELTVTRRLHRSGESEFLINRRPCRLKDIAGVFLGTGLGGRGYGVIEQGRIDQIIDQRPEDRRALVEEAAGVSRYRLQRAETLRKLDAAGANLTRLSDVIAEIGRQMGSLERQRRQAERHARLRERLTALELAQAARAYLDARAGLERAEEACLAVAERERQALGRRVTLAAGKAESEAAVSGAAAAREALLARLHALKEEVSGRRAEAASLEGEMGFLAREAARLNQAAEAAQARAEGAEERLARCSEASRQAAEERARRGAELASLPERLGDAAQELDRLRTAADTLKGELIAAMAARAEAGNALRTLAARQAELASRLERKEQEAAAARTEAGSIEERLAQARSQMEAVRIALATAKAEEEGLSAQAAEARHLGEEFSARLKGRQADLEAARSRLASLKKLCVSARGEATEGLLAAAKEIGAEHFLLSEALAADAGPEAELAASGLSAALGERLRAVVFARTDDALKAVALHRQRGRGLALALVMDLTPAQAENVSQGMRLAPPLERLPAALGGLRLAESLDEAISAQDGSGQAGGCTITRDGAALLPGGWLAAGGKDTGGGELLAWEREVRKLAARSAALEREVAAGAAELEGCQARAEELAQQLKQAATLAREQAARLTSVEAATRVDSERAGRLSERLRLLELETEHGQRATMELEGEVAQARTRAEAAAAQAAALEERVQAELAGVRQAEAAHMQAIERQSALKASLAALAEREAAALTEAQRLTSERAELLAQAEASLTEAGQVKARMTELEGRLAEARKQTAGLAGAEAALEAERVAAENDAGSLRAALSQAAGALTAAEAELEALRTDASEARLNRSELALRLEAIAARAHELHDVELAPRAEELAAAVPPETDAAEEARRVRESLLRLGEVNPAAPREYEEVAARHAETLAQQNDVAASIASLRQALQTIDRTCRKQFMATFEALNEKIGQVFATLFGGGTARLELLGEEPLEAGVDIIAQPPGKKLVHMSLLSGGEKAMAATALLFALHLLRPSPFYLLDELDAALDDTNVERLNRLLRDLSEKSQIIIVTHNKRTLEMADTLYGVTMEEPGVSKLVSVRLSDIAEEA
jgi:chromosome segregation protein